MDKPQKYTVELEDEKQVAEEYMWCAIYAKFPNMVTVYCLWVHTDLGDRGVKACIGMLSISKSVRGGRGLGWCLQGYRGHWVSTVCVKFH